jgi:hypothetical protein
MRQAAAVAAAALALTGCSSSETDADAGSLTGPTHFRRICVSTLHAAEWTIAVATAANESEVPVTLLEASLTDSEGIELVATEVIRPGNVVDTFGVWNGSPPRRLSEDPPSLRLWQSREPVEGNLVEPGERVNFLLHLRGEEGSSAGPLEITYRSASGEEHDYTTNVRYLIEHDCTAQG